MDNEACTKGERDGAMRKHECTDNDIEERLTFYVEWYVLDDDCGGYNVLVIRACTNARGDHLATQDGRVA